jgi:hypothetical protein
MNHGFIKSFRRGAFERETLTPHFPTLAQIFELRIATIDILLDFRP